MPVSRHRLLRSNTKPKTTATPTGLAVAVPTGLAVAMNAATNSSYDRDAESSAVCTEVSSDDELSSRLGDLTSRPAKKTKRTNNTEIRCLLSKSHDKLVCLTCGSLFTDKSPFLANSIYGTYYPWCKYAWGINDFGMSFRYPVQNNCAPCRNTYITLGYEQLLNLTLSQYNKDIVNKSSHAAGMHKFFLMHFKRQSLI